MTSTASTVRTIVNNKKQPAYVTAKHERQSSFLGDHKPMLVVVISWIVTRSIALYAIFQTWHPVSGWSADVGLYNFWAGNMNNGQFPLNDETWQYPPLAAVV